MMKWLKHKCQSFYIRRKYSLGWVKSMWKSVLLEFTKWFLKSIFKNHKV